MPSRQVNPARDQACKRGLPSNSGGMAGTVPAHGHGAEQGIATVGCARSETNTAVAAGPERMRLCLPGEGGGRTDLVATAAAKAATTLARAEAALPVAAAGAGWPIKAPGGPVAPVAPVSPLRPVQIATTHSGNS